MAQERIKAINYNVEEIGKYMKSSKKRFEWVVGLNKKTHTITLDFSFISGKVKVVIDGRVILENQIPINTSFQYPFTLDGFALNLIQQGQSCELRINNKVFSHLYIQAKTEQEFTKEKGEFVIAPDKEFLSKINNVQKMTLEIGNTKKIKKVKDNDEEGWGAFGGLGAPPGFDLPPGFQPTTVTTTVKAANSGAAMDFFADDDDTPAQVQPQVEKKVQQKEVDLFGDSSQPTPVVNQTKPAEVNIQSLYTQQGVNQNQNQFFTQIPNTSNFGNPQGFGTNIQQQYQTVGLQQNDFNSINFNSLNDVPQQPQSSQLNFGTNNLNYPQQNPQLNFGTMNNNQAFNTNAYGLNTLFATNNINMNTGANIQISQPNTSNSFFDEPSPVQQTQKQAADPFSALESMAIQSNFHTTSNNTTVQNNNNNSMFFTQNNVSQTQNGNSSTFDLL